MALFYNDAALRKDVENLQSDLFMHKGPPNALDHTQLTIAVNELLFENKKIKTDTKRLFKLLQQLIRAETAEERERLHILISEVLDERL